MAVKLGWGIGVVVAVLVSAAIYLLSLVSLQGLVSLVLLLTGLWTAVSAVAIVEKKDRNYYLGWGIVVAGLSLSYIIPFQYALAVILLAIVVLIVVDVYVGRASKLFEAATNPMPPSKDTPAATII